MCCRVVSLIETLGRDVYGCSNSAQIIMLCVEGGLEPFIRHLKAHKVLLTRIFFSFIILLQLRWPIESKFSQICYVMLVGINQGGDTDGL